MISRIDIEDMTDAQDEAPNLLADLARAKAEFQKRALLIHMGGDPAAALAAMDTPKGGGEGWQDFSTAPKDGTKVVFWLADELMPSLASWITSIQTDYEEPEKWEGFWLWDLDCPAAKFEPTHWCPLPAPPAAMKDGGA